MYGIFDNSVISLYNPAGADIDIRGCFLMGKIVSTFQDIFSLINLGNLGTAIRDPSEVRTALRGLRSRYRWRTMDFEAERRARPSRLAEFLGCSVEQIRAYEDEIQTDTEFQSVYRNRYENLEEADALRGTTGRLDATTLYVICRAREPDVVVETGVLFGSFDAYILRALDRNGHGQLHSIDLPEQPASFENGYLIPPELRSRWDLRLGDVHDVLPDLLAEVGPLDLFLHDSLHEAKHMRWEYEQALGHLHPEGILATHDVFRNDAFTSVTDDTGMVKTEIGGVGVAKRY